MVLSPTNRMFILSRNFISQAAPGHNGIKGREMHPGGLLLNLALLDCVAVKRNGSGHFVFFGRFPCVPIAIGRTGAGLSAHTAQALVTGRYPLQSLTRNFAFKEDIVKYKV